MTKTEKLYRKPPSYFKDMKALEASKEKINLAKAHLWDLLNLPLQERDFGLIIKLQKAVSHHEFLVEEEDND